MSFSKDYFTARDRFRAATAGLPGAKGAIEVVGVLSRNHKLTGRYTRRRA